LEARAAELDLQVSRAEDFVIQDLELHARGSSFSGIECPLAGDHQVENAITAALTLDALGVSRKGIAETRWPGRLEHVSPNPDVLLDGAHNPAGARALARYLNRFYGDRKKWMIFGAMGDKAVLEIGATLFPLADELILTAADSSRSMPAGEIAAIAGRGRTTRNVVDALQLAAQEASADDVIIVTGSLFLVGEARAASYNRKTWPFSGAWS
jgi:dihydrofolate synthase/folylpolyglutamate synthase